MHKKTVMKIVMKVLIVAAMLGIATESLAQTFGIKGGLNLANMLTKNDYLKNYESSKIIPGFNAGVTLEFPIKGMFSFDMGMLLSTKGIKLYDKGVNHEFSNIIKLLYIDIPLTAKTYFNVGNAKIYVSIGPYLGIGLSGEERSEGTIFGNTSNSTESVNWGNDADNDDLKRLDFGLTAGAGVEINSFEVGLSYGLGLANIFSNTDGGRKACNRVLGLSLGYKFGGK